MALGVRNLDAIKGWASAEFPGLGQRLYETLSDIIQQQKNVAQQTNANPHGDVLPPTGIANLSVTAQNGHFAIAITDNSQIYRGINYFVEHADNASFQNPQVIDIGQSRNHTVFLGNVTRFFRAYSSYASSPPSPAAYFGGQTPQPVTGGGNVAGPSFSTPQGSGTGLPGVGLQGPGVAPFRSATGAAPVRGKPSQAGSGAGTGGPTPPQPSNTSASGGTTNIFVSGGGSGPSGGFGNYNIVTPSGGSAAIALASQPNWTTFEVTANASSIAISNPSGGTTAQCFIVVLRQDSSGGESFTWGSAYHGMADQGWESSNASTYAAVGFQIRPDGNAMALWLIYADELY